MRLPHDKTSELDELIDYTKSGKIDGFEIDYSANGKVRFTGKMAGYEFNIYKYPNSGEWDRTDLLSQAKEDAQQLLEWARIAKRHIG